MFLHQGAGRDDGGRRQKRNAARDSILRRARELSTEHPSGGRSGSLGASLDATRRKARTAEAAHAGRRRRKGSPTERLLPSMRAID